jgi:hypothetical protein
MSRWRVFLFSTVIAFGVLLYAKQHIPAHCMRKLDFSRADCRRQTRATRRNGIFKEDAGQSRWLVCNNVMMDADCDMPGPSAPSDEKLSCSGTLEVKK